MQVETYEIEEITGELENMAADSDAIELIQKLGLSGQSSICNTDTATRLPYRRVSQLEANVFSVLFPQRTTLEKFNSGPIPLRVLKAAEKAVDCGLFTKGLYVLHPRDAADPDPVLIGATLGEYDFISLDHLIARWGDSLLPFDQLVEKAKQIWSRRTQAELDDFKSQVDRDCSRVAALAEQIFSGVRTIPSFHYLGA